MNFSVSEADRTNLLRDGEPQTILGVSKSGNKPRPIRKRAFWRAYKRKELWAVYGVVEKQLNSNLREILNQTAKSFFDPHCLPNTAYVMWPPENNLCL